MEKQEATENHKKEAIDGKNKRLEQSQVAHKGCRNIFQALGKEKPKENVDPLLNGTQDWKKKKMGKAKPPCAFFYSVFTSKTSSSCNSQKSLEEIVFLPLYKVINMQKQLFLDSLNFSYLKSAH